MNASMFPHEQEMNRRFLQLHRVASIRRVLDRPAVRAAAALCVAALAFVGLYWDAGWAKLGAALAGMTLPAAYLICSSAIPRLERRVELAARARPERR